MSFDVELNADVGEGVGDDEAIIAIVDRANVACGFHAGDPATMARTVALSTAHGVSVGAHISYLDREGFGRRSIEVEPDVLVAQLRYQIGALLAVAGGPEFRVDHVKAHGALYNDAAADERLASLLVDAIGPVDSGLKVVTLPHCAVAEEASKHGLEVVAEGFPDRAYSADGSLVPRDEAGAVVTDPDEVARHAVELAARDDIDSLCVHGDTPGAVVIARAVRAALSR